MSDQTDISPLRPPDRPGSACCAPSLQGTCCDPSAKVGCCDGEPAQGGCGCN